MKEVKWNETYNVGIKGIDDAHRAMIAAVKSVFVHLNAEENVETRKAYIQELQQLRGSMLMHFADEEAYMKYIRYDGYIRHKHQHDRTREYLHNMEQELVQSNYARDKVLQVIGRVWDG